MGSALFFRFGIPEVSSQSFGGERHGQIQVHWLTSLGFKFNMISLPVQSGQAYLIYISHPPFCPTADGQRETARRVVFSVFSREMIRRIYLRSFYKCTFFMFLNSFIKY